MMGLKWGICDMLNLFSGTSVPDTHMETNEGLHYDLLLSAILIPYQGFVVGFGPTIREIPKIASKFMRF